MYSKDEKVLCFHQELLYDAKILDVRLKDPSDKKSPHEYLVHYKGWKNTYVLFLIIFPASTHSLPLPHARLPCRVLIVLSLSLFFPPRFHPSPPSRLAQPCLPFICNPSNLTVMYREQLRWVPDPNKRYLY